MSAPRPQVAKHPRERTVIRQRDRAACLHEYIPVAARFKYQLKAQEPTALRDFDPADVASGSKRDPADNVSAVGIEYDFGHYAVAYPLVYEYTT
jgi:hypothetical protein